MVAVGPGALGKDGKLLPMSVAVGDRVLLPEYGGQAVKIGEDEFSLYREDEIRALKGVCGAGCVGTAGRGRARPRWALRTRPLVFYAARPQRTPLTHTYSQIPVPPTPQARSCSRRAYSRQCKKLPPT